MNRRDFMKGAAMTATLGFAGGIAAIAGSA